VSFYLNFDIPKSIQKINFSDEILFLGSCFSDEISSIAKLHGFNVTANPFGTLFHPLAIARAISDALDEKVDLNLVQNNDVYFDYSCSGKIYGMSLREIQEKVLEMRNQLKHCIENARFLFITFGTSFAYHLNESNEIVGNCHKQPAQKFTKKLTEALEILIGWQQVVERIKQLNPELKISFTISPVRHIKDGLFENNVSKSNLFVAVNKLTAKSEINYFPSFELVNDVLRDHRFFKADLIHPNEQAVEFVWQRFQETFMDSETILIAKKVREIKIAEKHRLQFPESELAEKFHAQLLERKENLDKTVKGICW
jgi:hypothetical protein